MALSKDKLITRLQTQVGLDKQESRLSVGKQDAAGVNLQSLSPNLISPGSFYGGSGVDWGCLGT
jgi:hypothetical protein